MDDPHDDTDVPSGTTDGAQMERALPPVSRREGAVGGRYLLVHPSAIPYSERPGIAVSLAI